ncbi:MAG: diacylglycerol kinase [Gammaproteobacteria bacterium]|nr:diacylglycerol kinase [Gammaproteobacteria bacterium]
MSEFNQVGGLTRVLRAFGYSMLGLRACWRYEAAFRQEALLALVVIPLGLWLGDGATEKVLLVGSWLLVMIVELLNSAIEAVVDRFGAEHHDLCGRAKDMGSAAVFLTISLALLTWGLILLPRWL